ncbi:MAG: hypothetical protein ACTHJW_09085 [Streptosporangiaceae bacterium]
MNRTEPASNQRPPVACDMSAAPDTPADRLAEYRRLFAGFLIDRERSEAGIRFRFRGDPGIEAWVGDLAAREKACCAFFNVAVTATDLEVRWDLSVIDDDVARLILADFYELPDTLAAGETSAC